MRDIFLLGCERSGSTWLSNIFDAHPGVEFSMEPFADYARLFPGIADRNTHATGGSPGDCATLTDGYAQLASIKYPLLYRPGRPVALWRAEQRCAATLRRACQLAIGRSTLWQDRYQLLQLNSIATPMARLPRKNPCPTVRVTKELRLNFKLPLLRDALPDSRFIVILRNPAAQIASVQRWMGRGRLVELRRALDTFDARVTEQDRFSALAAACGSPGANEEIEEQLARWWALNYTVLLEDLDRSGARYHVVRHERLAANPSRESGRLLEFSGLKRDAAVNRYIDWSSHTAAEHSSATTTVRNSAEFAADAVRNAPARVTSAIEGVLSRLDRAKLLHDQIAAYLPELEI